MKTYRILAAALLAAGLASCEQKIEYKDVPFVAFNTTSISAKETAGSVDIAVTAYSFTDPFSVTFGTVDNKAIEGDFYEVVGNDAHVLRFTPEAPTQNITIGVVDKTGTFTGAADFTIKLLTATGDATIAGNSACKFVITDTDHPLSAMLGDYNVTGTCYFGRAQNFDITIEPDENDVTMVWLSNLSQLFVQNNIPAPVYGVVSEDMKTISIPFMQVYDEDENNVWAAAGDYFYLTSFEPAATDYLTISDPSPSTFLKLIWDDTLGGYVNDSRFTYGGVVSGKLGNYYSLYYAPNGLLFKKKK